MNSTYVSDEIPSLRITAALSEAKNEKDRSDNFQMFDGFSHDNIVKIELPRQA